MSWYRRDVDKANVYNCACVLFATMTRNEQLYSFFHFFLIIVVKIVRSNLSWSYCHVLSFKTFYEKTKHFFLLCIESSLYLHKRTISIVMNFKNCIAILCIVKKKKTCIILYVQSKNVVTDFKLNLWAAVSTF